jgi:hypothetical protein
LSVASKEGSHLAAVMLVNCVDRVMPSKISKTFSPL